MTAFEQATHRAGRIWMLSAGTLMLLVPAAASVYFRSWPGFLPVLKGLLGVAPIFWTVGFIEIITYAPMLGSGGSYLGFVTGNLTNLKVPCALNAIQVSGFAQGSEEAEQVATIAIAVSSIVTTLVIALGVLTLSSLQPLIQSVLLAPAFANILPALFGALAVVFVAKNWKLALGPMAFMVVLFVLVPALASMVGILVPVGSLLSIGLARLMYRRHWL